MVVLAMQDCLLNKETLSDKQKIFIDKGYKKLAEVSQNSSKTTTNYYWPKVEHKAAK